MSRRIATPGLILLLSALLALAGCGLLQAPEEPSGPIEAAPLESDAPGEDAAEPGAPVFSIDPASSMVRFELDEDLRGNRITVVGQTNQVAGQLALDPADLSTVEVGEIRINARTLATDNNFRNRAIQGQILLANTFEFITFTPSAVNGLPERAAVGDTVSFEIVGDLTIRDTTQPVTFTVEATLDSAESISGTAAAVIDRTDFDLRIPEVPNVANVEEEVDLYIDFVANAG